MYNSRYLMRIISCFLPKHSEVLGLDESYKTPAILQGDIDEDGEIEILALYKRNQNNYILMLKLLSKKWCVMGNYKVDYKRVSLFKLVHLVSGYRQIALGGIREGEKKETFSLFNWKDECLEEMLRKPIYFDKVYIEDIDGEDGLDEIAIWMHKELEAYDIEVYRYQGTELIKDKSLEKYYFKGVVNYYEYLHQISQGEELYEKYLKAAKRKCRGEEKVGELPKKVEELPKKVGELPKKVEELSEKVEELSENVEEELGREVEEDKKSVDTLVVRTGYFVESETEEEAYLWGKRQEDYITNMKLIVTKEEKKQYVIVPIASEKVYEYQLFIGDFTGDGLDDIWLGVKDEREKENFSISIFSLKNGQCLPIFESSQLDLDNLKAIYPVDRYLTEVYEICCELTQKVMWLRWEADVFIPYYQDVTKS